MARDTVPAKPFADWLNNRTQRYDDLAQMAEKLGVSERVLYRYRHCLDSENAPTDEFNRARVDEMLRNAGHWLWDVYDERDLYAADDLKPMRTLMQPDVLVRAKELYDLGTDLYEVARFLHDGSGYASTNSLRLALRKEFLNQGWPLRSKSEESLRRWQEGQMIRNPCKGRGCRKAATTSGFCVFHDPAERGRMEEMISHARSHIQPTMLPVRPFQAWLLRRVEEEGGFQALARKLGRDRASITSWARAEQWAGGVRREVSVVRQDTVEWYLAADGLTLEDIYSEQVAA